MFKLVKLWIIFLLSLFLLLPVNIVSSNNNTNKNVVIEDYVPGKSKKRKKRKKRRKKRVRKKKAAPKKAPENAAPPTTAKTISKKDKKSKAEELKELDSSLFDMSFGAKVGMNYSMPSGDPTAKGTLRFANMGVRAELNFTDKFNVEVFGTDPDFLLTWAFELDIIYTQKVFELDNGICRADFITIPLHLKNKFNFDIGMPFTALVLFGPSFVTRMTAHYDLKEDIEVHDENNPDILTDRIEGDKTYEFKDGYQSFIMNFDIGIGFELDVGFGYVTLDVIYSFPFGDETNPDNEQAERLQVPALKQNNILVYLGWKMALLSF